MLYYGTATLHVCTMGAQQRQIHQNKFDIVPRFYAKGQLLHSLGFTRVYRESDQLVYPLYQQVR